MMLMTPLMLAILVISWFLLRIMYPFTSKKVNLTILGGAKKGWRTYVIYGTLAVTILLWMFEKVTGINSYVVALFPIGVFALTRIIKSSDLKDIDWACLWMVAGGFALGTALNQTGLATTLINTIPFASWNALVVMLVGGLICYFLSNFISNSAAANLVVPILVVVGKAMAGNPSFETLGGIPSMIAGIAICASVAMCLPVSTPPNALAASTGMITTKQMATMGIILGVVGIVLGYVMLIFIGF
jgi:sodium-dependent dicarboxylate transporter 2/3/5